MAGQFVGNINFGGDTLQAWPAIDMFIAVFDENGSHVWSRDYGDNDSQRAWSVVVDPWDYILSTGEFWGQIDFGGIPMQSSGGQDVFVVKLGPDIVGVEEVVPFLPSQLELNPNPFNPSTEISFVNPQTGRVRVQVFDLQGRLVKTLVDENMSRGTHTVTWDGTSTQGAQLPSGVYNILCQAGNGTCSRKGTLIK